MNHIHSERRCSFRHEGHGLVANICGVMVDVMDISPYGVKLAGGFVPPHAPVSFYLMPRDGDDVDLNRSVKVTGSVLREEGTTIVFRFTTSTHVLLNLIAQHGDVARLPGAPRRPKEDSLRRPAAGW